MPFRKAPTKPFVPSGKTAYPSRPNCSIRILSTPKINRSVPTALSLSSREPGRKTDPTNPLYLGPKTDEQIDAFLGYVRFMVDHFKGQIDHWELWNEEDWVYWQPDIERKEKAKWYGRVFCRFADTVHTTNPDAKVMFGGVAGLTVRPASTVVEFAEDALAGCPGKIDIMAYHSYAADPSGTVRPPEEIDTAGGAADFRKGVLSISGVRPDLEFWLNEWNANPEMKGSNSSVQARYLPRFYLEQFSP